MNIFKSTSNRKVQKIVTCKVKSWEGDNKEAKGVYLTGFIYLTTYGLIFSDRARMETSYRVGCKEDHRRTLAVEVLAILGLVGVDLSVGAGPGLESWSGRGPSEVTLDRSISTVRRAASRRLRQRAENGFGGLRRRRREALSPGVPKGKIRPSAELREATNPSLQF